MYGKQAKIGKIAKNCYLEAQKLLIIYDLRLDSYKNKMCNGSRVDLVSLVCLCLCLSLLPFI